MEGKLEKMGCNCPVRFASKATSSDKEWLSHFVRYVLDPVLHSNDCSYRIGSTQSNQMSLYNH
jgi:hypothetical protein